MKTKRIILICVGILLGALLIAILVNAIIKHEYFVVRGDIKSVTVASTVDSHYGGPVQTSDKEQIAVLLECIKKAELNNRYAQLDVETAPIYYDVTFEFSDGRTETRKYTQFPATQYVGPFSDFYAFFR